MKKKSFAYRIPYEGKTYRVRARNRAEAVERLLSAISDNEISPANEFVPFTSDELIEALTMVDDEEGAVKDNPASFEVPYTTPLRYIPLSKFNLMVLVYESQDGNLTPVLSHTFHGRSKGEAEGYFFSHVRTDKFLQGAIERGEWNGIQLRVVYGWVGEESGKDEKILSVPSSLRSTTGVGFIEEPPT